MKLGCSPKVEILPAETTEQQLLEMIDHYNSNDEFHGILVQLPLPKHINEDKVIERISPEAKMLMVFIPSVLASLVIGKDTFYPCTPNGILELIQRYKN